MEPIEEMSAFFTARVKEYDDHMLTEIEGMKDTYGRVATLLPERTRALLDLGCGTGLELEAIFARFPDISVTGIDMTPSMLDECRRKYAGKALTLIEGSYFDVEFGQAAFDAALSVETLHHFTHGEKRGLYRRLRRALQPGGVYIEADYMVDTQAEEDGFFAERARLLSGQGAGEGFWHFDTPCTIENQMRLLEESGFAAVQMDFRVANTVILVARAG